MKGFLCSHTVFKGHIDDPMLACSAIHRVKRIHALKLQLRHLPHRKIPPLKSSHVRTHIICTDRHEPGEDIHKLEVEDILKSTTVPEIKLCVVHTAIPDDLANGVRGEDSVEETLEGEVGEGENVEEEDVEGVCVGSAELDEGEGAFFVA